MSIQAVLTNWLLRYQFKRAGRGPINVAKARAMTQKLATRNPPVPKDVTHTSLPANASQGLCPAEWLSVAAPQRTIVYFHGGGYFFCSLETHRPVVSYLAHSAQARVLSLDYRLAPEHPYPAAVEDAVAWWRHLCQEGVSPHNVIFAGDSAGGGLALACMAAARDQGLPMPAAALLFSPWTDLSCSGETMHTKAKVDVMFNPESLPQAAALYLKGVPATDPLASPLFANLEGLPPLMIHASEHEILLSDSTRLHERALAQGVRSEIHLRPKLPHVWPTMVMLPEARETLKACATFMARHTTASI